MLARCQECSIVKIKDRMKGSDSKKHTAHLRDKRSIWSTDSLRRSEAVEGRLLRKGTVYLVKASSSTSEDKTSRGQR